MPRPLYNLPPSPSQVAIGYQASSFQNQSGCFGDRICPTHAGTQTLDYPRHYTNYGVLVPILGIN
jgi:hypothetical protein